MKNTELTKIREEKKLTKGEFAKVLGISAMLLGKYEKGTCKIPDHVAQKVRDSLVATEIEVKKTVRKAARTVKEKVDDTVQSETFSSDIENYNNISTYSKDGPVDDSSLVYVYCECKLPNISTAVPSLRQLFVTKNDSGDLVISDWSQYQDFVTDSNKSEDVQSLIREVNAKCQQLAETDEDLKAYLESQGIGTSGEDSTESNSSGGSSSNNAPVSGGTAVATDGVNVRAEGSTNGAVLATLYPGQEVNVVSSEGDWTHITFTNSSTGGTIDGYVSTQYLQFSGGSSSTSTSGSTAQTTAQDAAADSAA